MESDDRWLENLLDNVVTKANLDDDSTKTLINDLSELKNSLTQEIQLKGIDRIIIHAKNGLYHDYKSENACPKLVLLNDAKRYNLPESFINNVNDGRYDN